MNPITNLHQGQNKVIVLAGYDNTTTNITLASGHGAMLPDVSTPYNLIWWNASDYLSPTDDPYVEVVKCIAKFGDTLVIMRSQQQTLASPKNIPGKLYNMALLPDTNLDSNLDTNLGTLSYYNIPQTHGISAHTGIIGDHSTNLSNVGTNTHAQIDTAITASIGHIASNGTSVHSLGTMSTQSAGSVTITGGSITGITDLTVSGNVGIGTTNPTVKLEVSGGDISIDSGRQIQMSSPGDNNWGIKITPNAVGLNSAMDFRAGWGNGYFRFIDSPGIPNVRMIIEGATGNVGIGTTTPTSLLDVAGNIKVSGTALIGGVLTQNGANLAGTAYQSQSFQNLLKNGNFESWSNGASAVSDSWGFPGWNAGTITRDSTNIKYGTYSAKMTTGAASAGQHYQNLVPILTQLKGKTLTLGAWVKSDSSRTTIHIYDDITGSTAVSHSGNNQWEFLTVTKTIGASATDVYVSVPWVTSGDATTTYVDGAILVEGSVVPAFSERPIFDDGHTLNIDSINNRVGINTTPSAPFHVLSSGINLANSQFLMWSTESPNVQWYMTNDGSNFNIASNENANMFSILRNGNIGIGTASSSAQLQIGERTSSATPLVRPLILQSLWAGTDIQQQNFISFVATNNVNPNPFDDTGGEAVKNWHIGIISTTTNFAAPRLSFLHTGVERVVIDNTGNVGIGTTTPTSLLDVNGTVQLRGIIGGTGLTVDASGNVGIGTVSPLDRLHVNTLNGSSKIIVDSPAVNQAEYAWYAGGVQKWTFYKPNSSNDLRLYDGGDRVTFQGGGNVGVGTTNPTAKLHIGGTPGTDGIKFPDGTLQTTASTITGVELIVNKNAANGYAGLDGQALISPSRIPVDLPHTVAKTSSANLRHTNPYALGSNSTSYQRVLYTYFPNGIKGTLRIDFSLGLDPTSYGTAYGKIYKRVAGVATAIGTERTTTAVWSAPTTFSENINVGALNPGDAIEIWAHKTSPGNQADAMYFKIYYDDAPSITVATGYG